MSQNKTILLQAPNASPLRARELAASSQALRWHLIVILLMLLLCLPFRAFAAGGSGGTGGGSSGGFSERASKREGTRWTLQEWLEQRDRGRLMDVWLSMNSPSPFEFMFGGSYNSFTSSVDSPKTENSYYSYSGELQAYAQFIGIGLQHENNVQESMNDLAGMLNIRLLGSSLQNSSLTLHLGQRTRTFSAGGVNNPQRNVFSQVTLQLHLAKVFGIKGHYRYYEPSKNDVLSTTIGGTQTEAGLFIDFKSVRIFGGWFRDVQTNQSDTSENSAIREGIRSGLQIFY